MHPSMKIMNQTLTFNQASVNKQRIHRQLDTIAVKHESGRRASGACNYGCRPFDGADCFFPWTGRSAPSVSTMLGVKSRVYHSLACTIVSPAPWGSRCGTGRRISHRNRVFNVQPGAQTPTCLAK